MNRPSKTTFNPYSAPNIALNFSFPLRTKSNAWTRSTDIGTKSSSMAPQADPSDIIRHVHANDRRCPACRSERTTISLSGGAACANCSATWPIEQDVVVKVNASYTAGASQQGTMEKGETGKIGDAMLYDVTFEPVSEEELEKIFKHMRLTDIGRRESREDELVYEEFEIDGVAYRRRS